jgi:hypothetical protein
VAHYRIYTLSERGSIVAGSDAECPDDAAAKAFTIAGLEPGEIREVWRGRECIGFFTAPRGGGAIASRVTPAPDHRAGAVADGLTHTEGSPPPSDLALDAFTTVILGHG